MFNLNLIFVLNLNIYFKSLYFKLSTLSSTKNFKQMSHWSLPTEYKHLLLFPLDNHNTLKCFFFFLGIKRMGWMYQISLWDTLEFSGRQKVVGGMVTWTKGSWGIYARTPLSPRSLGQDLPCRGHWGHKCHCEDMSELVQNHPSQLLLQFKGGCRGGQLASEMTQ